MQWHKVLGWGCGLWLAAGLEAATGGGIPGPLLLVALIAGLWEGVPAGIIAGVCAGIVSAVLANHPLIPIVVWCALCGAAGGLCARWLARRHFLVGIGLAFIITTCTTAIFGATTPLSLHDLSLLAIKQGVRNALWLIPIYGIVFIVTYRRPTPVREWDVNG